MKSMVSNNYYISFYYRFHCYPTPEQYAAQYYSYIASHGALRSTVPKTNSIGNYRFQPY